MYTPKITIITPTYNRPDRLNKLFLSLKRQTNFDFCWWIINDGSTVSYVDIENKLKNNSDFEIKLFNKENGGKHRAINYILPLINSDLTIIIDDDDYLIDDGIEIILKYAEMYMNKTNNVASLVFERADTDGVTPLKALKEEIDFGRRFQYLVENKLNGDFTDVFNTKALKEFRLPEFKDENFISEGPLYFEFSQKYDTVFIKKILSVGGYNVGGLSDNIHNSMAKNINGSLYELSLYLSVKTPLYYKIKKGLLYGILLYKNKKNKVKILKNIPSVLIFLIMPFGYIMAATNLEKLRKK